MLNYDLFIYFQMRSLCHLIFLLAMYMGHPTPHPSFSQEYVNSMLDLVDSGFPSPAEGRAKQSGQFFIKMINNTIPQVTDVMNCFI